MPASVQAAARTRHRTQSRSRRARPALGGGWGGTAWRPPRTPAPPPFAILPPLARRRTSRARQRGGQLPDVPKRTRQRRSSPARLRASHPLQHVLHRAHGERKLLRVARAQDHVGIGPVLRIEEWIAADRNFGIGLGDLAELGADVALARIRTHGL